jgi:predicted 2-oxoglutarate/Fe(II)-dependent dioxygenase YbiX
MIEQIEPILPNNVVGGCISIYKDAWKNTEETINQLNNHSENQKSFYKFIAAKTVDQKSDIRTNYSMPLHYAAEENSKLSNIVNQYDELLYATSMGYTKHFDIEELPYFNEGYNVLKYQTGQEYGSHYDGGSQSGRHIAAILYLNDDFEGGDIEFVNFGITIKPEKGMFLLFPATFAYRHIAHPVTSGTKYAIVTWLHDRQLMNNNGFLS